VQRVSATFDPRDEWWWVIMIAEKAADLIRGREPLAPVNV
jgi:hypothetical protein